MAYARQVMRAADHAIEARLFRKSRQCAGMGLGVLRRFEACGPDIVIRQAREDRDGNEFRLSGNGVCRCLHHVEPPGGMEVDDRGAGLDPHQ